MITQGLPVDPRNRTAAPTPRLAHPLRQDHKRRGKAGGDLDRSLLLAHGLSLKTIGILLLPHMRGQSPGQWVFSVEAPAVK